MSGSLALSVERTELFTESVPVATTDYLVDKQGRVFGPSVMAVLVAGEPERLITISPLKTELILKLLRIIPEDEDQRQESKTTGKPAKKRKKGLKRK